MRRLLCVITAAVTAAAFTFAGCGPSYDRTTFVLNKDGSAKQYIIDDAYADTAIGELRDYINASLDEYQKDLEDKPIKLEKCDIDGGKVDIELSYASCTDYAAYNNVICFDGTLEEAAAAGYDLNREYLNSEGGSISYSDITAYETDKEKRVLIMNEVTAVDLPGTLLAYTSNAQTDEHGRLNTVPDTDKSIPEEFRTVNYNSSCFIYEL